MSVRNGVVVALLHQAHCNTGHRGLQRNAAASNSARLAPQKLKPSTMNRSTPECQDTTHASNRAIHLHFNGQHRGNRALRQCTVAHFAPASAGHTSRLTNAERREVVVQHEVLPLLAFVALEPLAVVRGAERCRHQGLRFTTRKQRRTVGARQHASLNCDRANFVKGAAIGANAILGHLLAEGPFAKQLIVMSKLLLRRRVVGWQRSRQFVLDLLDQPIALGLGVSLGVKRVLQTVADLRLQVVVESLVNLGHSERALRLAGLRH